MESVGALSADTLRVALWEVPLLRCHIWGGGDFGRRVVHRGNGVKDDRLIRPLSSSIRPRFYPCTGLHLPHPLSARTYPALAGALLMSCIMFIHVL